MARTYRTDSDSSHRTESPQDHARECPPSPRSRSILLPPEARSNSDAPSLPPLIPQIAGVNTPGHTRIRSAFNNRAAIGKHGHLMLSIVKSQREFIGTHR